MDYSIKPMAEEKAVIIANWEYEPPYYVHYYVHNRGGTYESIQELTSGLYYSVFNNQQELIGYFCYGKAVQVPAGNKFKAYDDKNLLDVGLGLKPNLCGRGKGYNFMLAGLKFAKSKYEKDTFRLTVATFNKRAIKLYKKIGFREDKLFHRQTNNEKMEFITMKLQF